MRNVFQILGFASLLFLTACGENKLSPTWPAVVTDLEGFNSSQASKLMEAIDYLNQNAGQKILFTDPNEVTSSAFPISFAVVGRDPNKPKQVGLATFNSQRCHVDLVYDIFNNPTATSNFIPVVIHEIGHCSGMEHVDQPGEVMYTSASSLTKYTEDALKRFFTQLLYY